MWKYGWFPLHSLLRIFLAISFVNWEPHKCNSSYWKLTFGSNQCWINYMKTYLKIITLKCEIRLACSGFDFSAGYLPCKCIQMCSISVLTRHKKRPKARTVQKQWMIKGSIFAFPGENNPLRGFVVFTNKMVLENKCVSRPVPPAL